MKIFKHDNKKEEINWDKQQLLIAIGGSIVLSNGYHDMGRFQGVEIGGKISDTATYCSAWIKTSFKLYEGSITLSND